MRRKVNHLIDHLGRGIRSDRASSKTAQPSARKKAAPKKNIRTKARASSTRKAKSSS